MTWNIKKHTIAHPLSQKQAISDVSNCISLEWTEIIIIFISHLYVDHKVSDLVEGLTYIVMLIVIEQLARLLMVLHESL